MHERMGGGWVAVGSSWPLTPFLNGSYMPVTATHLCYYYFTTLPYFANILPHNDHNILIWTLLIEWEQHACYGYSPLPATMLQMLPPYQHITSYHLPTTPHTIVLHATKMPCMQCWSCCTLLYSSFSYSQYVCTPSRSYCAALLTACKATELRVSPKRTAPIPINLQPSSYLLHLHAQSTILFKHSMINFWKPRSNFRFILKVGHFRQIFCF